MVASVKSYSYRGPQRMFIQQYRVLIIFVSSSLMLQKSNQGTGKDTTQIIQEHITGIFCSHRSFPSELRRRVGYVVDAAPLAWSHQMKGDKLKFGRNNPDSWRLCLDTLPPSHAVFTRSLSSLYRLCLKERTRRFKESWSSIEAEANLRT